MRCPAAAASTCRCGEARGRAPGVREYFERYPYTLPRAARVESDRLARPRALGRGDARAARLSRSRRAASSTSRSMRDGDDVLTAYVLSIADEAGWRFPSARARAWTGARSASSKGRVIRYSRAADRGPDDPQGRGDRSAVAARGAAQAEVARQHRDRAQPVADVGGDRLVPASSSASRSCRSATSASGGRADPALAPELPGHDDGFSTEKRRAVVAHDLRRRERQQAAARARRRAGMEGRHAAAGARRARPHAARALEHDGRQRVGRGRAATSSRAALRDDAGRPADDARRSASRHVDARVASGDDGTRPFAQRLAWPAGARRHVALAPGRHRRAVGDVQSLAAIPLKSAAVERLRDQAHGDAGRAEDGRDDWRRGDISRVPARSRRADRHDVGRGRRSDSRRQHGLGHGLGRRLDARSRRAREAKGTGGRRSTSARSRRIAPTTATCPRAASSSSTRCGSTTRARSSCRPTRVEAMYAPEMFGELPNARSWAVQAVSRARRSRDAARSVRSARRSRCAGCRSRRRCAASAPGSRSFADVRPRTSRPKRGCSTATASRCREMRIDTRACAGSSGCRSRDVRRRCSAALDRRRGQALLRARRRRLAGLAVAAWDSMWRTPMAAGARRLDAHDAARRLARSRARADGGSRARSAQKWGQAQAALALERTGPRRRSSRRSSTSRRFAAS